MDYYYQQIADALQENNAVLLDLDICVNCMGSNKIVKKFLLLDLPWVVKGKTYPCVGLFLCSKCNEVNQIQMLKNLRYIVSEFNMEYMQ